MKRLFIATFALCITLSMLAQNYEFTPDRKLRYAAAIIESYYVDSVNSDHITEEAIKAMLKTLDPHSQYSSPKETKDITEPLEGNFSGIGIQFNMMQDTLYVIETISGGPSERVGIRAGDRIISANDTVIAGVKMKNTDIMKRLRGPKGTIVTVKVLRRGEKTPIEFRITRDNIPIYSVDAAYMADKTTGYIRISRFAKDTPKEVREALDKLKQQGMKNILLDVQDNGGGYMNAAIEIANNFLRNGDLIVYTDSPRMSPYYFHAEGDGKYTKPRVVVLVNQYSASASEILAGAIQDNDRGLVIGRRTFGKGLVQRPFPFPDGSMIRLTISRYHTPSGRCIQKPYEDGDTESYGKDMLNRYNSGEFSSADSIHFADSLKYATLRNHRVVYGGGGIMPDRFVAIDTTFYSTYYRDLVAKGVLNQFGIDYVDRNRDFLSKQYRNEGEFVQHFVVTDEMMQAVIDRGEKAGVKFNEEQYATSREYMCVLVKALIARDLYDISTYYRVANQLNPIYAQALQLINNSDEYDSLLRGNATHSPTTK